MNTRKISKNQNTKDDRIRVLPKNKLMNTLLKTDLEKLIKRCWYEFLDSVYKDENFLKILAYINPSNASVRISNIMSEDYSYSDDLIEIYSIDYEEIRNVQGASLLQSRFYIDKYLEKQKKEGMLERCREDVKKSIENFF